MVLEHIPARLDSCAVDRVGDPATFKGIKVRGNEESEKGSCWVGAGKEIILKLGQLYVPWNAEDGRIQKTMVKACAVGETLLSTSRLEQYGWMTTLSNKWNGSKLRGVRTVEVAPVKRSKGTLSYIDVWVKILDADE